MAEIQNPSEQIVEAASHYQRNIDRMVELLEGVGKKDRIRRVGIELERFLITRDGQTVTYKGDPGVQNLLEQLLRDVPEARPVMIEGNLLGLTYEDAGVEVAVSLEPAAQVEVAVGPCEKLMPLRDALANFDRYVASALEEIGLDAALVASGYNPNVQNLESLPLIPKERYRDMDAYLSRTGRYARDMMRASASTQISLDYENEEEAARIYRMGTILGPLFSFLFDNAPRFRDQGGRMARSRIWKHVDCDRCGIVPGALNQFTFERYARWVSSVNPILFTDRNHVTHATGSMSAADIMAQADLTDDELRHLMSMVFPDIRMKGFCEIRELDALEPDRAVAAAAFVASLLYDEDLEGKLAQKGYLRQSEPIDSASVEEMRGELERDGWRAWIFDHPVTEVVETLKEIVEENLSDIYYEPPIYRDDCPTVRSKEEYMELDPEEMEKAEPIGGDRYVRRPDNPERGWAHMIINQLLYWSWDKRRSPQFAG